MKQTKRWLYLALVVITVVACMTVTAFATGSEGTPDPQADDCRHLNQLYLAKDPSCTEDGYYVHYKCDYCGKVFQDRNGTMPYDPVLPATNHDYGEIGICLNEANGIVCGHYEAAAGSGTMEDPYLIANAGNLLWFAAVSNEGYEDTAMDSDACAKVTAEIEIPEGFAWTPIGKQTYYGVFDGGNYNISGLVCTGDLSYVGMFGKIDRAELKNIRLSNSTFTTTDTVYGFAGGVVGYAYGNNGTTSITNCTVSYTTVSADEAGGIVGRSDSYPTITSCHTDSCTVTAETSHGIAGGIVGTLRMGGTVSDCISGSNTVTGYYCGGIAGYVENQAGPYVSRDNDILRCTAYGTFGNASSEFTGGIVGYVSATTDMTINNCRTGNSTLTAAYNVNSRAGGLLGNAYGDRDRTVKVTNSYTYNITISGFNLAYLACGSYVDVENCYANIAEGPNTPLTVGTWITKVQRMTDAQFASGEVCWLLNKESPDGVWAQTLGLYPFPNLGGSKVYYVYTNCAKTDRIYTNNPEIPESAYHAWEYAVEGNEITAYCANECGVEGSKVTLKLDGSEIYDGTEKTVLAEGSLIGIEALPAVVYEGNRVNAGSFIAYLILDEETAAELTVTIAPKALTVSGIENTDKIYDGTTVSAAAPIVEGILDGDNVTVTYSACYTGQNTGTRDILLYNIALTGEDAGNYEIVNEISGTGLITAKEIVIRDVVVEDKFYDGTTDAEVSSVMYDGVLSQDTVTIETTAAFDSAASGKDKTVTLTFAIKGDGKENYTLTETTMTVTADILPVDADTVMDPLKDVTTENVTDDDIDAIEDAREKLEQALEDPGLTEEQRKELEDALGKLDELEDALEDANRAVQDESVEDTKEVTKDNVHPEDREDLEQAKDVLEDALENFGGNYSEEQKEIIQDHLDRINDALEALDRAEAVEKLISELPETVSPDDEETAKAITEAQKAYNDLSDYEKTLVSKEAKDKLDRLAAALTAYKFLSGNNGSWTKGTSKTLRFVINGAYSKFSGIKIDGKTVASSKYTAASGSTVIELKASYLEGLKVGSHTIEIVYTDGSVSGSFHVAAKTVTPATGDEAKIALWSALALISAAAVTVLIVGKKRFSL